jgi:hypothetical protein
MKKPATGKITAAKSAKPDAEACRHILTTSTMPFTNNPSAASNKARNEKNKTQRKTSMSIRQHHLCFLLFIC